MAKQQVVLVGETQFLWPTEATHDTEVQNFVRSCLHLAAENKLPDVTTRQPIENNRRTWRRLNPLGRPRNWLSGESANRQWLALQQTQVKSPTTGIFSLALETRIGILLVQVSHAARVQESNDYSDLLERAKQARKAFEPPNPLPQRAPLVWEHLDVLAASSEMQAKKSLLSAPPSGFSELVISNQDSNYPFVLWARWKGAGKDEPQLRSVALLNTDSLQPNSPSETQKERKGRLTDYATYAVALHSCQLSNVAQQKAFEKARNDCPRFWPETEAQWSALKGALRSWQRVHSTWKHVGCLLEALKEKAQPPDDLAVDAWRTVKLGGTSNAQLNDARERVQDMEAAIGREMGRASVLAGWSGSALAAVAMALGLFSAVWQAGAAGFQVNGRPMEAFWLPAIGTIVLSGAWVLFGALVVYAINRRPSWSIAKGARWAGVASALLLAILTLLLLTHICTALYRARSSVLAAAIQPAPRENAGAAAAHPPPCPRPNVSPESGPHLPPRNRSMACPQHQRPLRPDRSSSDRSRSDVTTIG